MKGIEKNMRCFFKISKTDDNIENTFFIFYSRPIQSGRKISRKSLSLEEFDDLLGREFFSADWAELVGKIGQAFEAGTMAAVKNALFSLVVVVFFQADAALDAIVFWLF